jgi:lipopolysaccharide/colanic/teichoic acid biosynthesis glycosyltransferase
VFTTAGNAPPRAQPDITHTRALYFLSLAQPQVTRDRRWYDGVKRAGDLAASIMLLTLLAPVLLLVAIAIRATSPGPAILVQERVGRGGRVFPFFKFRSMFNHGDQSAEQRFAREYIDGHHNSVAGDGVFKPANEKRVTPIGRLLRKTSLDELPQLLNVLRGEMSLVGPRPSMPYEVDVYKPWHFRRLEVLPGISGLAQIRGRSSLPFKEIVKIDIEYIDRRSLALDCSILLSTLPVVLSGRGAR